ncbi:lipopolysaccharide assembly protein LapB [Macrococcus sp. DPC7161]|uniref:tetratricopeptide repeat protein n=1 Tax=Macrococcus sp. DPC7161 TaxID=2507060 RepID=UPI00100B60B8|nr:tetratricopeptide repeat protein [Macrococcus sp. DPC7161]RXK18051.1 tetratricopeptide repeat protein [Macrococcus sp. DPC7161]
MEKVIVLNQENHHVQIGQKKLKQQNYQEAITHFQMAFSKNPSFEILKNLLDCYKALKQYNKAEMLVFHYLADHFDEYECFYELSQIYIGLRNANKAFLFGMYYVQMVNDESYLDEMATLFEVIYHDKERAIFESKVFVTQMVFQNFYGQGRIETALDFIENAPFEVQNEFDIRNLKAMALLFLSRYDQASKMLVQLLEEREYDINALCHYTLLLYNTHQTERYDQFLKKLTKLTPMNDDERLKLGIVLSYLSEYESSKDLLYPLYKKGIQSAQLLYSLSKNLFYLDDVDQSETLFQAYKALTNAQQPSPKERFEQEQMVNEKIYPLVTHIDLHHRLLGIYYISKYKDQSIYITDEIWDVLENMSDFETLYLSFIFNKLTVKKTGFIHEGLVKLDQLNPNYDALFIYWIDKASAIIAAKLPLKYKSAYIAATYYLFESQERSITKKEVINEFDVTMYQFNKALLLFKQNDI